MPKKYHLSRQALDANSSEFDLAGSELSDYGSVNSVFAQTVKSDCEKGEIGGNAAASIVTSSGSKLGIFRATLASLVACIGSMSVGFNGAYASPAIPDLNNHHNPFHVDREQQSWFVSVAFLSSIVGALATSVLVDKLGRKLMLMLACLPFVAAWIMIAGSTNPTMFIVARLISGFSGAVTLTVVSLYIAEIAPADIRGLLMSLHEVLLNVGILIIYVAGAFLHWNWLAIVCVGPPVLLAICMMPVPETPRYLMMRGRDEEATEALGWLRGGDSGRVQRDLLQIRTALAGSAEKVPWLTLFKPPLLKYLAISQILFILQEFSGVNVVRTYTVTIFQSSGSNLNAYYSTIVVGAVMVFGSVVCALVVDRIPRRAMLLFSATVMTVSHMALGTFFYVLRGHRTYALTSLYWLPLLSLLVLVFGYTLGFGPLAFVITNEMFPTRARGRVCSLGVVTLCLSGFCTTKFFGQLRLVIGDFGVYWLCGCICFVGWIFVFFCVPETKGRSLEELERQLKLK